MKQSTWIPSVRVAALAAFALFSTHCGQSQGDDGGGGAAQNGASGTGAGNAGSAGASAMAGTGGGSGGAGSGGDSAAGQSGAGQSGAGENGAGEGGVAGTPENPCPAMRPQNSTACLQAHWYSMCTYANEECRCFTPDFMYQPPLWQCSPT